MVEREVDRIEVYIADEVVFCRAFADATPTLSVDTYVVGAGKIGDLTGWIQQIYRQVVRGDSEGQQRWRIEGKSGETREVTAPTLCVTR